MVSEIKKNRKDLDQKLDQYSLLIQKNIGKLVGKIFSIKQRRSKMDDKERKKSKV